MKQGIILAVLLSVAMVGYSQKLDKLPKFDSIQVDSFKKLLESQRLTKGGFVASTFSHRTPRGKVYTLQPDNMPCLVPDMKSVATMPNAGRENLDPMNVWPQKKVIPEGKE